MKKSAVLLLSCPDRKGIVAAVAGFVAEHGGNILHADEHGDHDSNTFLMRVEFDPAELDLPLSDLVHHFSRIASEFDMQWRLALSDRRCGGLPALLRRLTRAFPETSRRKPSQSSLGPGENRLAPTAREYSGS